MNQVVLKTALAFVAIGVAVGLFSSSEFFRVPGQGAGRPTPTPSAQQPPISRSTSASTPGTKSAASSISKIIYVRTAAEFIKAIRSNVTIILKSGVYNLSKIQRINTRYVRWVGDEGGGYKPIINSVENLTILGESEARIHIDWPYAVVLTFHRCKNVSIQNLKIGHDVERGECLGSVLYFEDSDKVEVKNSVLFGSGTFGLELERITNMTVVDTTIKDCTYGIALITDSSEIRFERDVLRDNRQFDLINIRKSSNITFTHCNIEKNQTTSGRLSLLKLSLFEIDEHSNNIILTDSRITNNNVAKLVNAEGRLTAKNNYFEGNKFDH